MGAEDSSDDEPETLQYKILLCGNGTVGKTSIINRFTRDHFAQSYKQTIGLDFFSKHLVLPGNINVTLQVWDIGGQQIGGKMIRNYLFGSHAILLVYDITNYDSFQDLEDWLRLVKETYQDSTMPLIGLVGNKTDLGHMRLVMLNKHNEFADEHDMVSYFTSAKTGDQVNTTFYRIAADLTGVVLSKPELEVAQKVVAAELVNHPNQAADPSRSAYASEDPYAQPQGPRAPHERKPSEPARRDSASKENYPAGSQPVSRSSSRASTASGKRGKKNQDCCVQ